MTTTPMTQVQVRAATDPEYRAALVADPRDTLLQAGIEVPEQVTIRIEESSADEFVLTLPPLVDPSADGELDEDQLASASGGFTMIVPGIVLVGYLGWKYGGPNSMFPTATKY